MQFNFDLPSTVLKEKVMLLHITINCAVLQNCIVIPIFSNSKLPKTMKKFIGY